MLVMREGVSWREKKRNRKGSRVVWRSQKGENVGIRKNKGEALSLSDSSTDVAPLLGSALHVPNKVRWWAIHRCAMVDDPSQPPWASAGVAERRRNAFQRMTALPS